MRELLGRLTALDPVAGDAVRIIAYFDELVDQRAGLETIVRGAAYLAGCPARLIDDARHLRIRVGPDGHHLDPRSPADDRWPAQAVSPDGTSRVLLERDGATADLDRIILERSAVATRAVIDRTRTANAAAHTDDAASVEILLDHHASDADRHRAARRLGLAPDTHARALAIADGHPRIEPAPPTGHGPTTPERPSPRTGVGPTVPLADLPTSWDAARTALRFTADGDDADPGPRVVHADDLGVLAVLADHLHPGVPPPADVRALDRAAAVSPWMLTTLDAVATATSLRAAADQLTVHHSTLQHRLVQAEHVLGWDLHPPGGRLRLHLALVARRLHRNA